MTIFLIKSLLSILLLIIAIFSMITMFEVFGRTEKRFNIENLKKIHGLNGKIYFILYFIVAYFCLDFIINTKAEPSPRVTFHIVFSLTVFLLLCVKISYIRIYKQFYGHAKTIGLLIGLITFGMVGTSGGYYLLITKFGTDKLSPGPLSYTKKEVLTDEIKKIELRTDSVSIAKGKELYESKCYFCHDAYSMEWGVGPGHKGILKNPFLPASKKSATPENIVSQIISPYKDMPSFDYMSEDDVLNLIAYLNTL